MPEVSATRLMRKMYGKTRRVSVTVSANFPGSSTNPGANSAVQNGANTMPTTVSSASSTAMTVASADAASTASSRDRLVR